MKGYVLISTYRSRETNLEVALKVKEMDSCLDCVLCRGGWDLVATFEIKTVDDLLTIRNAMGPIQEIVVTTGCLELSQVQIDREAA